MTPLNFHPAGRHFLQIPGPTSVPDRVLRAIDHPTIDHRGPEFAKLGLDVLARIRLVFQTAQPVIIYTASGTGAWEAALVNTLSPGDRVLMAETGHFASLWKRLAERLGLVTEFLPGDWRHAADPEAIHARLADDRAHAIKAVCIVHNETSTGVVSPIPEIRRAIDRAAHPALLLVDTISSLGSIDYRHDDWGVDVTVGGLAEGADAAARAVVQRDQREGARRVARRHAAALVLGLGRHARGQRQGLLAVHAGHQPALRAAGRTRPAAGGRAAQRVRAARPARRGDPPRGARLGPGDPLRRPRAVLERADRGDDAGGTRRRRLPPPRAPALRHVARHRPRQARRQGVPDRASGRLQRPDADGHARRRRDGAGRRRRAASHGRRAGRAGLTSRTRACRCRRRRSSLRAGRRRSLPAAGASAGRRRPSRSRWRAACRRGRCAARASCSRRR